MNDGISSINPKNLSLRDLIGISPEGITWGRLANFIAAVWISNVLGTIFSILSSEASFLTLRFLLSFIGSSILFSLLFAAFIAVVFRWVPGIYTAILVSTVGYSILSMVIRKVLSMDAQYWLMSFLIVWLWYFLLLMAPQFLLPKIKPIAAALALAYFSAGAIQQIARIIIYKITRPEIYFRIGSEIVNLLFIALEAGIFAGLLWIGFRLRWARWQFIPDTVTASETLLPGTGDPPLPHELSELKKAADSRVIQKLLRPAGIGSIVFGLIAIVLGVQGAKHMPINSFLVVIGGFLLLEGIWCSIDPKPVGLVVDGIALLILGVWNIIITISNLSANSGSGLGGFIVLGIWQISWGVQGIKRYKHYSYLSAAPVNPEDYQRLDKMIEEVNTASESADESIIEFQVKQLFKKTTWKGKSFNHLVLLASSRKDFLMEKISDVKITPANTNRDRTRVNATLNIGGQALIGELSPVSLDRITRWILEAQKPGSQG